MKEERIFSGRNIVVLITCVLIFLFIIYIGPYDGLSRNYDCEWPDTPQLAEIRADASYEREILFEKGHLSAIEIYTDDNPLTEEDEIEIIIENITNQNKLISIKLKGNDLLSEKWIKVEAERKVHINDKYQMIVKLNTKADDTVMNVDIVFGYRDSFSLKLKILLIAAVLVLGAFMCIVPKFFFYDSFMEEWKKEKETSVIIENEDENQQKIKKKVKYIILMLILALFTIISCYVQYNKEGYHVDEVLTYTLTNHTDNSVLPRNQKLTNTKEIMDKYLSVNELNRAFNYRNVWEKQHSDTHPPFYYALLHTLCSFIQNRFTKWISFSINLFFGILSIIVINKIYHILLKDENIVLVLTFLYAVNPAIIEMTSFLRMYVMAMFFCLLSAYWIVKNWGRFGIRFLVGNSIILIMGTLTHYYFLVYAFFASSVLVLYLLIQKEIKEIFRFVYSVILSAGAVFIIFPGIQYHLLNGGRGPENINNFFNMSDYLERIRSYTMVISTDLVNGFLLMFVVLAFIGYIMSRKDHTPLFYWRIVGIVVPVLGYFFIISKVASYITDRYISLIYPHILIGISIGIWLLLNCLLKNQKKIVPYVFSALLLSIEIWGYKDYVWDYSGGYYKAEIKPVVEQISSYDCICMSSSDWRIWAFYPEFIQYKTVTFTDFDQEFDLDITKYEGEKLVIYIPNNVEVSIQDILKKFNQYQQYDVVHEDYSYCDAYILY